MHGRRCASKFIPQGRAVAQGRVKAQSILLFFRCHGKRIVPVSNCTAEIPVYICTQGTALVPVESVSSLLHSWSAACPLVASHRREGFHIYAFTND